MGNSKNLGKETVFSSPQSNHEKNIKETQTEGYFT